MNASPLIFLTRVGLLEVLREPAFAVMIPDAVVAEIEAHGTDDPTSRAVRGAAWLEIAPSPPAPDEIQARGLGAGESAALTVALNNPGAEAILDDRAARRCAESLAIPVQGTLGLIVFAKRIGMVSEIRPVVERLRRSGMYLTDRMMARMLALAGEPIAEG